MTAMVVVMFVVVSVVVVGANGEMGKACLLFLSKTIPRVAKDRHS